MWKSSKRLFLICYSVALLVGVCLLPTVTLAGFTVGGGVPTSLPSGVSRYYVSPSETDHGATTNLGTGYYSMYDVEQAVGASKYAVVVLRHTGAGSTTEYTLDTSINWSARPYLFLEIEPGARLVRTTGDETITLYSPENLIASPRQQVTDANLLVFSKVGLGYPGWWGAVGDDSTDCYNAITYAIQRLSHIHFPAGTYQTTDGFDFKNKTITGEGQERSIIKGVSGIAVGTSLLAAGRTSIIENMQLRYDTALITGSEAVGERVLLETDGDSSSLQRGSAIRNVRFNSCGTALYAPDGGFSITLDTLEIQHFTYAGVYLSYASRTANAWNNIYISNDGSPTYTPAHGFALFKGEAGITVTQLNIEHSQFTDSALLIDSTRGFNFHSIHMEGVDISGGTYRGYIDITESGGTIGSLTAIWTRMSQDGTCIFKLRDSEYNKGMSDPNTANYLYVHSLNLRGLADPNSSMHPDYPAGRRGLDNIAGFRVFYRDSAYTDEDYYVTVDNYSWNTNEGDEEYYYLMPRNPHSNIITTPPRNQYSRPTLERKETLIEDVSGATEYWSNAIPAGAVVRGVTSRVTTGLGTGNGTTGYAVGTGADVNMWGDITGTASGTTSDSSDFTAANANPYTSATNIAITAAGGNFDGTGDIRLVLWYERLLAPEW